MTTPIYLSADFYKLSHREQYPEGTEYVYSTLTPRSNKFAPWSDKIVFFGLQYFIKEYLMKRWNDEFFSQPKEQVVNLYKSFVTNTLGKPHVDTTHLEALHDLGYLPIMIKALPEGTEADIKVPVMTIENTHPDFFWLTNFMETILSTTIWQPITSATLARKYRKILDEYALKTTGSTLGVDYQAHDFSMRGMSSEQSALLSGMGHLTSFVGSDTIPAIFGMNQYYHAPLDATTGTSLPATEHSVMCSYGQTNEFELFKHLATEVYPTGFFSVVSDTWDFWKVVTEYLPALKKEIMSRDGRLVVRPDSGNPVDIVCGTDPNLKIVQVSNKNKIKVPGYCKSKPEPVVYQTKDGKYYEIVDYTVGGTHGRDWDFCLVELTPEDIAVRKGLIESLWDTFGGTVTEQGYKVLDPHIGAIYGDSITLERAKEISQRLYKKGFASTNVVFGVGSFSYQYHTRDTFGFAVKATHVVVNGEERLIFKDPKTDDGTKRSQRGRVVVGKNTLYGAVSNRLTGDQSNNSLIWVDGLTINEQLDLETQNFNLLQPVFKDGKLVKDMTLDQIKQTLSEN